MVEYKDIFDGYRVSSDGRVQSCVVLGKAVGKRGNVRLKGDTWRDLTLSLKSNGYLSVSLRIDGKAKDFLVASLMLTAFVGTRPDGHHASHENGVRTDNRIENLSWKTAKENMADKKRHGTRVYGEKSPRSILTEEIVVAMRAMREAGESYSKIASKYGIKLESAYSAIVGISWSHLPGKACRVREFAKRNVRK